MPRLDQPVLPSLLILHCIPTTKPVENKIKGMIVQHYEFVIVQKTQSFISDFCSLFSCLLRPQTKDGEFFSIIIDKGEDISSRFVDIHDFQFFSMTKLTLLLS